VRHWQERVTHEGGSVAAGAWAECGSSPVQAICTEGSVGSTSELRTTSMVSRVCASTKVGKRARSGRDTSAVSELLLEISFGEEENAEWKGSIDEVQDQSRRRSSLVWCPRPHIRAAQLSLRTKGAMLALAQYDASNVEADLQQLPTKSEPLRAPSAPFDGSRCISRTDEWFTG
jgi:hypothetical protein